MNFSAIVDTIKSKLPKPLEYFKDLARGDTPSRVSAVLALLAGLTLVAGFITITVAITVYKQKLTTELITVSGALVTLATFSKVDSSSSSNVIAINTKKQDDDDTKEEQG